MSNISIVDQLREMRLSAMAREFEAQDQDPATYSQIPFEERFGLIVNAGWNSQQGSKLRRRIRDAHFDIPSACMEEIEYFEDRKLNREELTRLSTCRYIVEKYHIILKDATGSGKTYIACTLGNAACRKFKRVRYVRMPELLDELTLACAENEFKRAVKAYGKVDLLILDEWLMRPLTLQQSYNLFEIIEARTKNGATIFCTQYDPDYDWYERLNTDPSQDSPISDAIMDRIRHNAYVISVGGKVSMCERHGLKAVKQRVSKMNDLKQYLAVEMKRYLTLVPDATEEEISDLKYWVSQGNTSYSNPWNIADECGTELPFIKARRIVFILSEEFE